MSLVGLAFYILISPIFVCSNIIKDAANAIHKGTDDISKGIFNGLAEIVGTPVTNKEVKFYLFTSKDIDYTNFSYHLMSSTEPTPLSSAKGRIYFLIHGWNQNLNNTPWLRPFTELILRRYPDSFVVQVDWNKTANENYPSAAFATESVGGIIANVIQKVIYEYGQPLKNIFPIGHSLGGQVLGWIGKKFFARNSKKLPRLIALDPAGPLFDVRPYSRRLNKNDADVVMVMHTNGGVFGFKDPCGTIDFFPNGGSFQPGCLKVNLSDISTLTDPIWCSHRRAYYMFVETVKEPECFIARQCKSYEDFEAKKCENNTKVSLGDIETTQTGNFYLDTTGDPPFHKKEKS